MHIIKKPFTYGFRGKARWRTNRVFFCTAVIVFFYIEIGKVKWSIEVANHIPLWVKYIVFATMFVCLWYSGVKIQRRVVDPSLPLPRFSWFLLNGLIVFMFAIISADRRLLFDICTSLTILFLYILDYYYKCKLAK